MFMFLMFVEFLPTISVVQVEQSMGS